jgi:hypothetical protein
MPPPPPFSGRQATTPVPLDVEMPDLASYTASNPNRSEINLSLLTADHPVFDPALQEHPLVRQLHADPALQNHPLVLAMTAVRSAALPAVTPLVPASADGPQYYVAATPPFAITPPEPNRNPRPPRTQPHLQPICETNKENLPPAQYAQLLNRQEEARLARVARRSQLPASATAPAALGVDLSGLAMVGRGGPPPRQDLGELELAAVAHGNTSRVRRVQREQHQRERRVAREERARRATMQQLNRSEQRRLAGIGEAITPVPIQGVVRATGRERNDRDPMDTGALIDPPPRRVHTYRR